MEVAKDIMNAGYITGDRLSGLLPCNLGNTHSFELSMFHTISFHRDVAIFMFLRGFARPSTSIQYVFRENPRKFGKMQKS